jgi:hypothetical protein
LPSDSFKIVPKTFRQLKEEGLQSAKPERELDSETGPESGFEAITETELIIEPVVEPTKDREPTPTPKTEPEPEATPEPEPPLKPEAESTPEAQAKPAFEPKPADEPEPKHTEGPEPMPDASVIPLGEPHREQLPKPEEVTELQPEPEHDVEPVPQTKPVPEPKSTPEPEPAPMPMPQPEPIPTSEPKKERDPIVEELTAEELIEAYEQDAAAADARFLGNRLEIIGVVALVDVKETLDTHYVRLAGAEGDISRSVRCMFDKKHAQALCNLEKGQTLTIQGIFNGSLISIRMTDCELA